MMNDDFNRGPQMQQGRKPFTPNRYNNPQGGYNYNYNQNQGGFNGQQHPRRRTDRFKRESINNNEKILRQNDLIIKLLKEIRDRLPAPPAIIAPEMTEPALSNEQQSEEQIEQITAEEVTAQSEPEQLSEPADGNSSAVPE